MNQMTHTERERANTQKKRIIEYMKEHGSITPMEAIEHIGCTKLSTRVGELKREGHNIEGKMEKGHSRWGEDCRYMRYWIA